MTTKLKECPGCFRDKQKLDATSRRDNKTKICSKRGTEEAYIDAGMMGGDKFLLGVEKKFVETLKRKDKIC